jgi:hypothetical protein
MINTTAIKIGMHFVIVRTLSGSSDILMAAPYIRQKTLSVVQIALVQIPLNESNSRSQSPALPPHRKISEN